MLTMFNKKIALIGWISTAIVIILLLAFFLLPNFLIEHYGECFEDRGTCCQKSDKLIRCIQPQVVCSDKNEIPVFKSCDSKCRPIIECEKQVLETDPETPCSSDEDCWCRSFDGAGFIEGKSLSECCKEIDNVRCIKLNHCARCYYK